MDPFVAEIRVFPFNFAPKGWALCNGQLLPISQNTALFSLLGTTYGGDGRSNFALPNLQSCAPMHPGQGAGLSPYSLGQTGGVSSETLQTTEMPGHNHNFGVHSQDPADLNAPAPNRSLATSNNGKAYQNVTNSSVVQMNSADLQVTGGSLPHNNLQPSLVMNFCICLQGIYPSRP